MEKKILQTNQCPFCYGKIDIKATKCSNCGTDLTAKEAQDKIRAIFEERELKKKNKLEEELKGKKQNKKIFLVVIFIAVIIILIARLKLLGVIISLIVIILSVIYKDKISKIIDKDYIKKDITKVKKIINKVIIIFLSIILLFTTSVLIYQQTPKYKQEQQTKIDEANRKAKEEEAKRVEEEKIAAEEKAKKEEQDTVKALQDHLSALKILNGNTSFDTLESLGTMLSYFKGITETLNRTKIMYPENKEAQTLVEQVTSTLKEKQKLLFPIMRKTYGKKLGEELWKNDITVKTFGTGNSTIEFIGSEFVLNKSISDFYNKASELLRDFRFEKANFRWYDGSDGTQFNVGGIDDSKLSQ